MDRENQRITVTKKMLREGLLRLLETKDIQSINITALCREAGINRATFYRHYSVPRDVLVDIERDFIEKTYQRFEIPSSLKETEAKKYLVDLCRHIYDHAQLIRVLIRANSDRDMVHVLEEFYQKMIMGICGRNGGTQMDEDSIRLIATGLSAGGYFTVRQWLTEGISKTPEEIAEIIFLMMNRVYKGK